MAEEGKKMKDQKKMTEDELNESLIVDSFTPLSDELEKDEDRKDDPE